LYHKYQRLIPVGVFLFTPSIPQYPKAKFPGVVVFSEIYQGKLNASVVSFYQLQNRKSLDRII